jgi:hypothetical protein
MPRFETRSILASAAPKVLASTAAKVLASAAAISMPFASKDHLAFPASLGVPLRTIRIINHFADRRSIRKDLGPL